MKKNKTLIYQILFPAILFLFPFRNVWLGAELTDGLYSAGNFRFPETINDMWFFSTYLANEAGKFLTGLPFGNTLLGLRIYCSLCPAVLALVTYHVLQKREKISCNIIFMGELIALSLCWCPITSLYNYLTYFLFQLAVLLLYLGLTNEKRGFLFFAGVALGMNLLVRFPNLAEVALILPLWYYGVLMQKRIRTILQETLVCIIGYLSGVVGILLFIHLRYGLSSYTEGILALLQMPSDAADYTVYSMVLTLVLDYVNSARYFLSMLVLTGAGMCLGLFGRRTGKTLRILGSVIFMGLVFVLFRLWYSLGIFNFRYYTYESMFQWVAIFLIITILLCFYTFFKKNRSRNEKLLAGLCLIVIVITPLGSNNHLYPNINNLFLVAPIGFYMIYRLWKELSAKEWKVSVFPIQAMLGIFLLFLFVQSIGFGLTFTFRDGMSGQKRDTKIEKNAILRGITTNRELAEAVEELTGFVEKEGLKEKRILSFWNIPAMSYILDQPSALSTAWPDLRSYGMELFEKDMEKLTEAPLIILNNNFSDATTQSQEQKFEKIEQYMVENQYGCIFENNLFAVYYQEEEK